MKVLQLIDSLQAGGTESMAVNYANALASRIEGSYLCATRTEGLLKESLLKDVHYLFLDKKVILDFKAIKRLNRFIKDHRITIIHAHSSSFFLGTMIRILNPKLILIWHDHYGESEFLNERPKFVLKWCSKLFSHVFVVNTNLENWSKNVLHVKSVGYLPNFAVVNDTKSITKLKGEDSKRIVCLANLRPQKDHINLLNAFNLVIKKHSDWSLHLIGQDFDDIYSKTIKAFIKENDLEHHVFVYGSCPDTNYILSQGSIGVLSSKSEGLPLALLEYGLAGLATITTNVGDCGQVISNSNEGLLIPPKNAEALADALLTYINDSELRILVGRNLQLRVIESFSESVIMDSIVQIYKQHQK